MDFTERLNVLSVKIKQQINAITTEEATKNSICHAIYS